ncbi:uncharacterized protein LOC115938788 isoform X2 [Leptonychotes weddellii]|uniref:Uncharacterized protein LOC115938788 isoform X2 n=1 Tax=Leptonychotes weddellii TaxID=9713 RepID=A0A7F8QEK6_LEPWE|nr:uncharacterized protein LOC115938788 isoform X2 [Leptonychotes weddellii]
MGAAGSPEQACDRGQNTEDKSRSSCLCGMGGGSCGGGQAQSAWARHCARHLQNVRHTDSGPGCDADGVWKSSWESKMARIQVGDARVLPAPCRAHEGLDGVGRPRCTPSNTPALVGSGERGVRIPARGVFGVFAGFQLMEAADVEVHQLDLPLREQSAKSLGAVSVCGWQRSASSLVSSSLLHPVTQCQTVSSETTSEDISCLLPSRDTYL